MEDEIKKSKLKFARVKQLPAGIGRRYIYKEFLHFAWSGNYGDSPRDQLFISDQGFSD